MWCASQWRNEVLYFLHVFTRCRTIWMRIPIDQSNDLICTMECDKRFEYFSLVTVNWCSTFMLEGFSMYLPHMTHTSVPLFPQTYWLAMHVWLVHSKQHMIQDDVQLLVASQLWLIQPTHRCKQQLRKTVPETKQLLLQGSYFPKISQKAHNHGSGKLS